jgi:hypothetical protein
MRVEGYRDPLLAALLAILPGSGHVYAGRAERGLAWLLGTLAGLLLFVVPGLVIWSASIWDAALCARVRNAAAPPLRLQVLDAAGAVTVYDDGRDAPPDGRLSATPEDRSTAPGR